MKMVLNDQLSVEDFKGQIHFDQWQLDIEDKARTVGQAFGKRELETYRQLQKEFGPDGRGMAPARKQEMDKLYKASVVMVMSRRWAFFVTV